MDRVVKVSIFEIKGVLFTTEFNPAPSLRTPTKKGILMLGRKWLSYFYIKYGQKTMVFIEN